MDGFEVVASLSTHGTPITLLKSRRTGLRVALASVEGPLVNGYFSLATEGRRSDYASPDDGLPHTLEHLVFLGSELYPYKGVLDLLATRVLSQGTNAWTDTDSTVYTVSTAGSEGFLALLPIYVDHILFPTLTDEAFLTEVYHVSGTGADGGVVYCEMQARENTEDELAFSALLKQLFAGHPYSSNTGGKLRNLRELSNYAIRRYHADYYRADNLCIIVTGSLSVEELVQALAPVEARVLSKADSDGRLSPSSSMLPSSDGAGRVRPWSELPVAPLQSSVRHQLLFPSEDESSGQLYIGWHGPAWHDFFTLCAIRVLLTYLTDSSVSPLTSQLVERRRPLASEVVGWVLEQSTTAIVLRLRAVPVDALHDGDSLAEQVMATLERQAAAGGLDGHRLRAVIKRERVRLLSDLESDPHDGFSLALLSLFLYAPRDSAEVETAALRDYLAAAERLEQLLEQPVAWWQALLRRWMLDAPSVVVKALPSATRAAELAAAEAARLAERKRGMGDDGLAEAGDALAEAMARNSEEPPDELLRGVSVPSSTGLRFFSRVSARVLPAGRLQLAATSETTAATLAAVRDALLADGVEGEAAASRVQWDHINTKFVQATALLNSSGLPSHLRPWLELYLEVVFECPVQLDSGRRLSHDDVVAALNEDALSYYNSLGFGGGNFECGALPQAAQLVVRVEAGKEADAARLLRRALYQSVFTPRRLRIGAMKLLADVAEHTRSGSSLTSTALAELNLADGSNHIACSWRKQVHFLQAVLQQLNSDAAAVVASMNAFRSQLLAGGNVRLQVVADVPRMAQPVQTWMQLVAGGDAPSAVSRIVRTGELLKPAGGGQALLQVTASTESCYLLQSAPGLCGYEDIAKQAALRVSIEYLCGLEGDFWRHIRGAGLAYDYGISIALESGLLYFSLEQATDIAAAYEASRRIVREYASGESKLMQLQLEAARSSIISEIVSREETMWDSAEQSLLHALRDVPPDYNQSLVAAVASVRLEDVEAAIRELVAPLFDDACTRVSLVVPPGKEAATRDAWASRHLTDVAETVLPDLEALSAEPVVQRKRWKRHAAALFTFTAAVVAGSR